MDYFQLAKQYEDEIIALRRDFHQHPELSYQEARTSQTVCRQLDSMGIPYARLEKNCVVGKIVGGKAEEASRRIAIRADMDALPVTEEADVPFRSQNQGVMHACGHDGHTAMLLGAARMLMDLQPRLQGVIYLCFQSAEEVGGAAQVIVEYLLAEGGVDRAIAVHLWADLDSGLISVEEGARMAANDSFILRVNGRGGHASRPDLSIDPIKPLCQIILAISAIPTNRIETLEPCVVHVGRVEAGTAPNIFPQSATAWGGVRAFSQKNREKTMDFIRETAEHIALSYGAQAQVEVLAGPPMVINDGDAVRLARDVLKETPLFVLRAHAPWCASEDFSLFTQQFGGFMAFIGMRNPEKGLVYTHHHPKFAIDEDVLGKGSAFFAAYARAFLEGR